MGGGSVVGARPPVSDGALPSGRWLMEASGRGRPSCWDVRSEPRTWVCQSRNHCPQSGTMDSSRRVTTDTSVRANWAFCPCRQFHYFHSPHSCRGSRKDTNLPQCCFVLCRFPVPAGGLPHLAGGAVVDEGPHRGASCWSESPPLLSCLPVARGGRRQGTAGGAVVDTWPGFWWR